MASPTGAPLINCLAFRAGTLSLPKLNAQDHQARPSVIFNLRDSFQDFLREAGGDNDGIPTSLDVLQQKAGIKLVMADRNDPDKATYFSVA